MVNNIVDRQVDDVFAALANSSRRYMIALLQAGPKNMSELASLLKISLPAMHKHIKILESAGLVTRIKLGRQKQITLQPTALSGAEEWLQYHRDYWNTQLDKLETHIVRKNGEL